jgi:mannose-6-phosphate isomerase-like protein (cupin superfamily)
MHRISLEQGGQTIALCHPMEAVYYLITGSAVVEDLDQGTSNELTQGSMFLVDPGTAYRVVAKLESAEIVGGPCPPDPSLYAQL